MMMVSENKIEEMQTLLSYYVKECNGCKLRGDYNRANDFLDMLLGGLSVYNILAYEPLEVKEYKNEIELVKKYVRR